MEKIKRNLDKNMYQNIINDSDEFNFVKIPDDTIELTGFPFINNDFVFRRLPLYSKDIIDKVHPSLNEISNYTSGGMIRFNTTSTKIALIVKTFNPDPMIHMTDLGQSGFDIYIDYDNKGYRFYNITRFFKNSDNYDTEIFLDFPNQEKEILINFPLYSYVSEIYIGYKKDGIIKKPRLYKNHGKIVFYGTSITQGGCVSRPGLSYPNILSRLLDVEIFNISFTGNAFGEIEIAEIISNLDDLNSVVLDYEANSRGGALENSLIPFIKKIREKNKDIPIIVLSRIPYIYEYLYNKNLEIANKYIKFYKNSLKQLKDKNVYFINCHKAYDKYYYDYTVDGIHPNDIGMYKLALYLYPKLKKIINK